MNRRAWLTAALLLVAMPADAEWRRDNREECDRVDAKLKEIESARRRGYTPKQGLRLRDKQEKLERQRREKCR